MQHKKIVQLLASAALVTALPFGVMAQAKDPVKVGLVSSKSGVFAEQGEEVMRAVKFAIEEANSKGGVDGRKVEVVEGDDESTPDAGRRVAEKMARDGYNLLIGAVPSSISLAIAQNLERWDAAYFIQASKSDKLTGDTCKPRSFRTNHSDAMDIAMINEWAKKIKGNTFAVIAADYVWGRDVDGIWVAEVGRDAMAFVKQAGEFNLIPNTPLIGHALISNFIINATGKNLEGVPGNAGYAADLNNPRNKEFVAAWRAKFNRVPTDAEGQAYNGAQVMFDGVRLAKSVKPEDVSKALRGAELNTIYGKVTMRAADNQLMLPNYVGRVKMVDGALRPVIEDTYPASLTPPPSPLCKM
jgi:branched-chain amino acid transport system substrate-binding protein